MLGAIIGDIAGSRFEFNPTNDYNFEIFAAGSDYTDDTICTVAVMDAILHSKDFGESLHEWCRRYPDPMGAYGGRFYNWIHSRDPKPYNSFGNGAAMRVSPVAWAYHNKFTMLLMASKSAECTHNHIEGIKGAQTVALAIHRAIELNNSYEIFGEEQMRDLLNTCVKYSDYDININLEDVQNKFDETCQGTVPVALWIIGQSYSFEDAIRRAVSLGADADTLGAIVGSIAEAIWGIPDDMMMEALEYLPTEMTSVVVRFYNRYVPDTILRGYGDEGAAEDFLKEEELREAEQQKDDNDPMKEFQAIMLWKVGLGHMGKFFNGENPLPDKTKKATRSRWKVETMPEKNITNRITVNHGLAEFGVNGDEPSLYLFIYLLTAETGGNSSTAWKAYLDKWEENHLKYDNTNPSNEEVQNESDDADNKVSLDDLQEEREITVLPKPKKKRKDPTVLPTFWHGGYIRRTYIFSHKDLEEIDELRRNGKAPLFGIKDIVSPKVKIRGSEGTIECCYWNDWEGLVRETLKVTYANNSVIYITQTKAEVLYEYDCGICF